MIKILSVDDEVDLEILLTQYFRRKIRKGEYEFFFAHNGLEALQMLLRHPDIDIILSDINMPEMDGLTMLTKVNEMRNPALKCIMVSAYGDMDNIRQAMNNGAFDFATKPIDLDDLQKTIDKAIEQIDFIKKSQAEHAELNDLHSDLSIARDIQHSILPQSYTIKGMDTSCIDIAASMIAAKDVGGDFYDFFHIDDTHLGFTMADVSGKGVPAALFMAVSRTLIKAIGNRGITSAECMKFVNDMLCEENVENMFVTVFYGIYDTKTHTIEYTNAGHNPPYVLHNDGTFDIIPAVGNLALGVIDGMNYRNGVINMSQGDTLIMFTDGVTEAFNPQGQQYGEFRLEQFIKTLGGKSSSDIVNSINEAVKAFAAEEPQSDDITQLVIRRI